MTTQDERDLAKMDAEIARLKREGYERGVNDAMAAAARDCWCGLDGECPHAAAAIRALLSKPTIEAPGDGYPATNGEMRPEAEATARDYSPPMTPAQMARVRAFRAVAEPAPPDGPGDDPDHFAAPPSESRATAERGPLSPGFGDRLTEVVRGAGERAAGECGDCFGASAYVRARCMTCGGSGKD